MNIKRPCLLSLNGGSSSIRFALYEEGDPLCKLLEGKLDRVGQDGTNFVCGDVSVPVKQEGSNISGDRSLAVAFLLDWLEARPEFALVRAVGHRVVFGMGRSHPESVGGELVAEMERCSPFDPEHIPLELELIKAIRERHPALVQVVCFDTAFHRDLPRVARLLPIPRRYEDAGVCRYGFHGLSYEFMLEELARMGDPTATKGRVILAHLGNGSSLAAVCDGRSVDTTMGFSPTGGLVMGSRSGDLDPGILPYLARTENMTPDQFQKMVTHESGLLGVSETSSDLRDLLALEADDVRAAEAISLFCYQVKKGIGSFAAALGGLDTFVFAGGIGENSAVIRSRICDGLGFLGIELYEPLNSENAAVISTSASRVTVRVIRTDEELVIARSTAQVLGQK